MKLFQVCLSLLIILYLPAKSQNWPACDSLVINCCTFDSLGANTITLHVSNLSSELFPYPNFALLDINMDTVAIESVTYFGIGQGFQPHTLNIIFPPSLPFNGYLYLFSWMQDTLPCIFPFTIPDTISGISPVTGTSNMQLFPNPAREANSLQVIIPGASNGPATITIWNAYGSCVKNEEMLIDAGAFETGIAFLIPGVYVFRLESRGNFYTARFVKL